MPASVHPSAVVGPGVSLGEMVRVGPFCSLDGRVVIGAGCRLAAGVAIGGAPMDRRYQGEETEVRIGQRNLFHEYTTVHRSTGAGTATVIGDDNLMMAYVHIAHNCRVGSGCTITNGTHLGGHVTVDDGANIGGLVGVHQFCRIGTLAMVGACSYVAKDIPPFALAAGNPCRVHGLNLVGLRRAGFAGPVTVALKPAFRLIYRSGLNLTQALAEIEANLLPHLRRGEGFEQVSSLVDFARSSRRGIDLLAGPEYHDATDKEET